MNKLIFNPEKNIEKLLDYGFLYDEERKEYILNLSQIKGGLDGIIIDNGILYNFTSCNSNAILVLYKLIKENMIIECEE